MSDITLIGGGIILGMACLTDYKKAIASAVSIVTIRGITFLTRKITVNINPIASDILDFAGWCLAGIPIVVILKLSTGGIQEIIGAVDKVSSEINSITNAIENLKFW